MAMPSLRRKSATAAHDRGVQRRVAGFPRWRRHGVIRPSVAGFAAILFGAGFWFMGLLLDDRALMAAALAVTIIFGCSLALAVTQWILLARYGDAALAGAGLRDARSSAASPRTTAVVPPFVRMLLPRMFADVRRQYLRLDQDGDVTERHIGAVPDARGLYRLTAVFVRWHDPFGLFSASRLLARDEDVTVLPHTDGQDGGGRRATDQRMQGMNQSDNTGGVRAYVTGDPPKLISWKATAHRGELMTRETGRDMRASTIIVLDARSDGITDARIDAQVDQALPLLRAASADRRVIVTDGVRFADDPQDCARLLAAMSPIPAGVAKPGGIVKPSGTAKPGDVAKPGETVASESAPGGRTPSDLAKHVAETTARQPGVVAVRLFTPHPQGELATALRRSVGTERLNVTETADTADLSSAVNAPAAPQTRRAMQTAAPREAISRLLTAAALLVFFETSVVSLTGLLAPTGYWPWFAGVALAVVACEANLPSRSRPRYAIRTAATVIAVLVAAATLVTVRIHDIAKIWLFDRTAFDRINADAATQQAAQQSANAAGGTASSVTASATTPLTLIEDTVERGFNALDSQLPPINVDLSGDVVLILAVAAAVILVRLLLVARRTAPAFAVLPVILFASNYALVGRQSDWWQIALVTAAFLIALWQVVPHRAPAPTPAAVTALVTAAVLALTTPAVGFANAVPLSFGNSSGLLSANTINPMVDLKRSLKAGSDSIVLTYRSSNRLYLRMTTLDEFNGDTWSFDEALAKDANLYGSGIQLGIDSSNMMSDEHRYRLDDPLSIYQYFNYASSGDAVMQDMNGNLRFSGSSGQYESNADITIETLRSRFLPMPGVSGTPYALDGSWLTAGSTVYNRESVTNEGMRYQARGTGVDTITSTSEFSRLDDVRAMHDDLEQQLEGEVRDRQTVLASRKQAITDGLATQHGQWLIMPVEYAGIIETSTVASLKDANGTLIGTAYGVMSTTGDYGMPELELNEQTRQRLAISDDEFVGSLYGDDGKAAIAILMDGGSGTASDVSLQDDLLSVYRDLGYSGSRTGVYSSERRDSVRAALDAVGLIDTRAHKQYRSLPTTLPANVTALVDQAKTEGVATDGDGYDHQVAAMRWLVDYFTDPDNGFTYSLDAPDGDGRSNLDVIGDFLDTRSGYCTHYASALAVLGRAMGVPTRMVLGYNRGVDRANGDGDFEVRAKQLHSWVEAYLDGVGWVPFDVTPATADNGSASEDGTTSTGTTGDSGDSVTTTITPDGDATGGDVDTSDEAKSGDTQETQQTQTGGNDTAAQADTPWWNRLALPGWAAIVGWTLLGLALVAVLALVPAMIRAMRRRRRMRLIGAEVPRAWLAAWSEICDTARDCGVRWDRADTERVIARRIAGAMSSDGEATAGDKSPGDTAPEKSLMLIADRVTAIAFGVSPEGGSDAGDLRDRTETVLKGLEGARKRLSRHIRVRSFLLPASLVHRQKR
ncbi:DUF58 domain-containing protein [Bifidobacterium aerophilum]|uniref:DUF58 domain-containing protein n=2 Tax=Bifidobacterium aerophilum TaxID=1798155 RepID=A0A6N9Z7E7_9BIFI|nr:DUF58 domain-containing protein [Bifidobacterium aerophilum]